VAIVRAIREWSESMLSVLAAAAGDVIAFIPGLIVAVLALLVAWLVAKILERVSFLVLDAVKFDELLARGPINYQALKAAGVRQTPTRMVSVLVFWALFFWLGLAPAAEAVGLGAARVLVLEIIAFIPPVLGALLIVVAAYFIAVLLRETISSTLATANLNFGSAVGWIGFVTVVVFGIGVALNLLNVGSSFIIGTIAVVGVTIGLALAIGFGIGARDVFGAIAAGRDLKDRLVEGDEVVIDEYEGTIERLGLDTVDLRTPAGLVSIPNNLFIEKAMVKKAPPRRAA
jgi:small-conductance mechanosensitive channel